MSLSAKGWRVVLSGRREEELKKTAGVPTFPDTRDGCRAAEAVSKLMWRVEMCRWEVLSVPGDVTNEEAVKVLFAKTIEAFGNSSFCSSPNSFSLRLILKLSKVDSTCCSTCVRSSCTAPLSVVTLAARMLEFPAHRCL